MSEWSVCNNVLNFFDSERMKNNEEEVQRLILLFVEHSCVGRDWMAVFSTSICSALLMKQWKAGKASFRRLLTGLISVSSSFLKGKNKTNQYTSLTLFWKLLVIYYERNCMEHFWCTYSKYIWCEKF